MWRISDATFVVDKAIDSIIRSNKLDLEKANDNVDWFFLCSTLAKLGFGDRWIR